MSGGTYINVCNKRPRYLRITAGPQRNKYVHTLIAEAMLHRELQSHETVEHKDGNTLNNDWRNIAIVRTETNTALMQRRRRLERDS